MYRKLASKSAIGRENALEVKGLRIMVTTVSLAAMVEWEDVGPQHAIVRNHRQPRHHASFTKLRRSPNFEIFVILLPN
jgi:hypothetical protein